MPRSRNKVGLLAILLLAACAPRRLPVNPNSCANAPQQLHDAWNRLQETRGAVAGLSLIHI